MSNPYFDEKVASMRLQDQSLEYLARESARPGNPFAVAAEAEITRRTAQAQIDAARWMKWSVVAIALSAFATFAVQLAAWLWPHS